MRIIRLYTSFIFLILLITGCQKETFTYNGPLFVEYSAIRNIGTSSSFQYYNSRFYFHNRNVAPNFGADSIRVQLIGPHQSRDLSVNYRIHDYVYYNIFSNKVVAEQPPGEEGTEWYKINSTAIAGVDYVIPSVGKTVIPSGSSFGYIRVEILTNSDNTDTVTSKMVFIGLEASDDVRANIPTSLYMLCFGKRNTSNPVLF